MKQALPYLISIFVVNLIFVIYYFVRFEAWEDMSEFFFDSDFKVWDLPITLFKAQIVIYLIVAIGFALSKILKS